jgi:hypothetical protein
MTPLTWHKLFHTLEGIVAVAGISAAAATLLLAIFTSLLAWKTAALARSTAKEIDISTETLDAIKRQALSAEGQVGVSARALEATFRPLVVDITPDFSGFDENSTELAMYPTGPTVELAAANRW